MCGLWTCPRMDVDPPRFLDHTAIGGMGAYRLTAPGVIPCWTLAWEHWTGDSVRTLIRQWLSRFSAFVCWLLSVLRWVIFIDEIFCRLCIDSLPVIFIDEIFCRHCVDSLSVIFIYETLCRHCINILPSTLTTSRQWPSQLNCKCEYSCLTCTVACY